MRLPKVLKFRQYQIDVLYYPDSEQQKDWSVGRDFLFQLKCKFLLLQHRFCIHNGKRKLTLTIVSANLVLLNLFTSDCQFWFCFMKIFWKMWKKVLQSWDVREGWLGYGKHLIFF